MSYLAPASFHFVRGIIKVTKGSDIANLASLEVLALRYVASKIYYHRGCRPRCSIKIRHNLLCIILVMRSFINKKIQDVCVLTFDTDISIIHL